MISTSQTPVFHIVLLPIETFMVPYFHHWFLFMRHCDSKHPYLTSTLFSEMASIKTSDLHSYNGCQGAPIVRSIGNYNTFYQEVTDWEWWIEHMADDKIVTLTLVVVCHYTDINNAQKIRSMAQISLGADYPVCRSRAIIQTDPIISTNLKRLPHRPELLPQ